MADVCPNISAMICIEKQSISWVGKEEGGQYSPHVLLELVPIVVQVTQTYALVAETLFPSPMVQPRVTVCCCQFLMELRAEGMEISLLVHHLQLS